MTGSLEIESTPTRESCETPSLRANFSWTFAGAVIYSACQWGMLSVLAKLGNAAMVGYFALGLAITAPVYMFTNLQLRGVQATDARSEFQFADYFSLRLLASCVGLAAVLLIAGLCRYDATTRLVVVLVGIAKFVETLSDVAAGLMQKKERLDCVAKSFIIRGVSSVSAFTAVFWRTRSLTAAVFALAIVWALVFVWYDLACARSLAPGAIFLAFRGGPLRRLAQISAPLGLVMTLNSLNVNIPRYFLQSYLGPAELGIFASLGYLLVALNLVVSALGQSATTRLAGMFASGKRREFRHLLRRLIAFGAVMVVLGVPAASLFGRFVLTILYRAEYARHVDVFIVMVAAAGVGAIASFLGYGMTAARQFNIQLPIIAVCTAATAALSWLLIPHLGLIGAAVAVLLSTVLNAVAFGFVLWRSSREPEAC